MYTEPEISADSLFKKSPFAGPSESNTHETMEKSGWPDNRDLNTT